MWMQVALASDQAGAVVCALGAVAWPTHLGRLEDVGVVQTSADGASGTVTWGIVPIGDGTALTAAGNTPILRWCVDRSTASGVDLSYPGSQIPHRGLGLRNKRAQNKKNNPALRPNLVRYCFGLSREVAERRNAVRCLASARPTGP